MPAFGIRIVDDATGRGIPMVALKTLHSVVYHTDNGGYIAFNEPDLMNENLYVQLSSAGYRYPKDEFGKQAIVLDLVGKDTILRMTRINIAERLHRLTGAGMNVHQQTLGLAVDKALSAPLGGILGQDSNLAARYKGKILWIWGDSFLPQSYKGNFSVSGAWSSDPKVDSWSANDGIDYQYITNSEGHSRPMIELKPQGYVWFDWLMNISNGQSGEQLVAKYARVDAYFGNYERGLALFNDQDEIFEKHMEVPAWLPDGHECIHPFKVLQQGGDHYYYLSSELAMTRIQPTLAGLGRPESYEQFGCLLPTNDSGSADRVERDQDGNPIYRWRKNVKALNYSQENELVDKGLLTASEKLLHTRDVWTGEPIDVGRGSVSWNAYRKRWIMIGGKQDIWYGEADTPVGPWVYMQKIVRHKQFFYNPVHHSFLDEEDGRRIFFEGTFTKFFSQEAAIPRYDYNQVQYGLSLDDPNLILPVPVYALKDKEKEWLDLRQNALDESMLIREIPFFALDRKLDNDCVLAIFPSDDNAGKLIASTENTSTALFYGLHPTCSYTDHWQGEWEMDISFRSFDNSVSLSLEFNKDSWDLTASKGSYQFSGLQIEGDSLSVELVHEETSYMLTGKLGPSSITGRFSKERDNVQGDWNATKRNGRTTAWACLSSGIVPLYEHLDKDGIYRYSTQYSDGARIICRVWENPSDVFSYDFQAVSAE